MSFLNLWFFFLNLKPGKLWGKTGLIIYSCAKILGYEMQPSTQRLCREVFAEINDVPYNKKNSVIHHLFLNLSRFSDPKLEISNRQRAHQCYQGNDYDVNYHYLTIASLQNETQVAFLMQT